MGRRRSKGAVLFVVLATMVFLVIGPSAFAAKANKTVQFKSGSYNVAENQSPAAIAITLNPKGSATVKFNTAGGTATGGPDCTDPATDYVAQPLPGTTVTFTNQSQLTTPVTICNNNSSFEGNETVVLQLSSPTNGYSLGSKKEVTLTINDDDPQPGLSINDNQDTEGGAEDFTVTTSAASSLPIQFSWSKQNGTATSPGDYSPQTGTEVIPAGPAGQTAVFNVTSNDDSDDEPTEFFNVVLSNVIGASVADGTGKFTLLDNDAAPTISIAGPSGPDTSATEGDPMSFVVSLSGPTGAPITVEFFTDTNASPAATGENNCGITGADFDQAASPNVILLTFNVGGATSQTVNRPTCDDADDEADEKFRGLVQNATYDGNPYPAGITDNDSTGTILDNDDPPVVDTTPPTSTSATVADTDSSGTLTVGDVITIVFDEAMNQSGIGSGDYIFYDNSEAIEFGEATFTYLNATTLQVTINAGSACVQFGCALNRDLTSITADSVEDVAGNDWAMGGDVTLEARESESNDTVGTADGVFESVLGSIDPGTDIDYYAVVAFGGETLTAQTTGDCNPGSSSSVDTTLQLLAPDGVTVLASNDDFDQPNQWCSLLSFGPLGAGTYYLLVDAYGSSAVFNYGLTVTLT